MKVSDIHYSDLSENITNVEVHNAVKHLKNYKAAVPDRVFSEMLKCTKNLLVPLLTKLYVSVFSLGVFLNSWAESVIVPLYKKGDPNDSDNSWEISLSSTLSKACTRI